MKTTIDTTMTMGSGDVFTDLGFSPTESRNLRLRSQMMTETGQPDVLLP
jgi:hypothetical protein